MKGDTLRPNTGSCRRDPVRDGASERRLLRRVPSGDSMRGRRDGSTPGWFGRRAREYWRSELTAPRVTPLGLSSPNHFGWARRYRRSVDADLTVEDVFRR